MEESTHNEFERIAALREKADAGGADTPEITDGELTEDSLLLEPLGGFIGCVDEVNGPGAVAMPGFVATRRELLLIAEYWFRKKLENKWFRFCYDQLSGSDLRTEVFASRRIARIADLVGESAVAKVEEGVMREKEASVHPGLWRMFVNGEEPQIGEDGVVLLPGESSPRTTQRDCQSA